MHVLSEMRPDACVYSQSLFTLFWVLPSQMFYMYLRSITTAVYTWLGIYQIHSCIHLSELTSGLNALHCYYLSVIGNDASTVAIDEYTCLT
jgi:hypothetical protein